MDVAVLQKEIEKWTPEEQDRLAAYLAVLRLKRNPEQARELARRLDDERKTDRGLTLNDVRPKLKPDQSS